MPALLIAFLSGCGGTTAAIVAAASGGGGGGGSSNSPASLTDIVIEARTSPARIRFTLTDAESNPVNAELSYLDPVTGDPIALALIADPKSDVTPDLASLESSPQGIVHEKRWNFGRPDQIATEALTKGVMLSFTGKEGALEIEPRSSVIDVGNDPPALEVTSTPGRSITGVARTDFVVSDSSNDLVIVSATYDFLGDDPDAGPAPATGNTLAGPDGQPIAFLWDSSLTACDLDLDGDLDLVSGSFNGPVTIFSAID